MASRSPLLRLAVIILLLVLFPLALWWVAISAQESGLKELRERGTNNLALYQFSLQGELEKFEFLPRILAQNKDIIRLLLDYSSKQNLGIDSFLESFNTIANASNTYIMDPKGLTVAASNWNQTDTFVGKRFEFRPYFQQAMKGQAGRYHALGTASQRRGFYFSYPIIWQEKIIGVTVVKIDADRLERLLSNDTATVVVTDAKGVIFLSTKPKWIFHTLRPLEETVYATLLASRQYDASKLKPLPIKAESYHSIGTRLIQIQNSTHNNTDITTQYLVQTTQIPYANWNIHLLTNTKSVDKQVTLAVVLAAVLMIVIIFAGGFLYQRRINLLERLEFQQHAREALEHSEQNTRTIISSTQAGLITIDASGNIKFFNPTAAGLFKYTLNEVADKPFTNLLGESQKTNFISWLTNCSNRNNTNTPETLESVAMCADSSIFPIEMAISLVKLQDEAQFLITIHDITERKRSEIALQRAHDKLEETVQVRTADLLEVNKRLQDEIIERKQAEKVLRQAQDELVQAGKLAAIGQMSAGISHELNQPLAAIRSYASNAGILLQRTQFGDVGKNLDFILELTDRMAEITGHLKTFVRKSSGEAIPVSLQDIIESALSLVASHTKLEGYQIHRDIPEENILVLGDKIRLEQVLLNLLKNALDAMTTVDNREIFICIKENNHFGFIKIRDTGPGIPKEQLKLIFDPFFTTKPVGDGIGLGLSISMGIVRDYGGTLKVANHPESGCEFTLELPKAP